jgi:cell division protein FtsA
LAKKAPLAVGLDAGSGWVRVVALGIEDNQLYYRGHSRVQARGWHRGQIVDQQALAETVRLAVREAEGHAGEGIGSAVIGVGGPRVRCQQGRGVYEFGHRRPIERGDMVYAVEMAARAKFEVDRALLQVLPQDFTVDGQAPLVNPLNIEALRLEAHALLITCSEQEHQALVSAVHQAHLKVEESVFEAMAAAYASILPEEREGGVVLADIGAHSTNLCYYDGDSMLFAVGIPLSGEHFTTDLGKVRALSFEEAERLKLDYGCALTGLSADNIVIGIPGEGGRAPREVSRRELVEILEARALQLFGYVENFRSQFARNMALNEGVVMCGGGAELDGMVEVAEKVLSCPARLAVPRGIGQWPDEMATPEWTVAAGLAMYAARLGQRRDNRRQGPNFWDLFTGR